MAWHTQIDTGGITNSLGERLASAGQYCGLTKRAVGAVQLELAAIVKPSALYQLSCPVGGVCTPENMRDNYSLYRPGELSTCVVDTQA